MENVGDAKLINNMPQAQRRLATKASLREHRKKKRAEKKTTRKPGSSLGSSRNPRAKLLME